jgi:hypothetical protein
MLEVTLNNAKIFQLYCSQNQTVYAERCNYLNITQNYLNNHLYSLILGSMEVYLIKKNDMLGSNYFESLE